MTLQHSLPLLEVRSQAQGLVEGWASVFNGIDAYGDPIVPGAYTDSLAQHRAKGTTPAMLFSHRMDAPIGRWLRLQEDERGLRVEGQLNLKTNAGREAFEHLRSGDVTGLSIGFSLPRDGYQERDGIRLLKRIELHEVSVVTIPADSEARVSAVKSRGRKPLTLRKFEEALEELGFSRREARNIAANGFPPAGEASDSSDELFAALKAATSLFTKG